MTGYDELRDGQEFYGNGYKKGYEDAKKEFETPKGEWIANSYGEHHCSKCGHAALYEEYDDEYSEIQSYFCPYCGRKMKSKLEGEEE